MYTAIKETLLKLYHRRAKPQEKETHQQFIREPVPVIAAVSDVDCRSRLQVERALRGEGFSAEEDF